jgi:hypothetical protein
VHGISLIATREALRDELQEFVPWSPTRIRGWSPTARIEICMRAPLTENTGSMHRAHTFEIIEEESVEHYVATLD